MMRSITLLLTTLFLAAHAPLAVSQTAADSTGVVESIEVKRAENKEPKHESLKFLKDNRVFIRAQIDLLRVQTTRTQAERAQVMDPRYLQLREMSTAIATARDSVSADSMLTAQRGLMASVTELGEIERQMAGVEALLADHRSRLIAIEGDFLGHQETALVILMRGFAGKAAPTTVVISEEGEVVRVDLTTEQRASLEQGGIAQLYHQFVEPRAHVFSVTFEGNGWPAGSTVPVTVDAVRDRLTFLSLDLSRLDPKSEAMGLLTDVWYR